MPEAHRFAVRRAGAISARAGGDRRPATEFERVGDEGNRITFRFCPACGATVYWTMSGQPDLVAVAVGNFADPTFPAPRFSVYESRRHSWVVVPDHPEMQRFD